MAVVKVNLVSTLAQEQPWSCVSTEMKCDKLVPH